MGYQQNFWQLLSDAWRAELLVSIRFHLGRQYHMTITEVNMLWAKFPHIIRLLLSPSIALNYESYLQQNFSLLWRLFGTKKNYRKFPPIGLGFRTTTLFWEQDQSKDEESALGSGYCQIDVTELADAMTVTLDCIRCCRWLRRRQAWPQWGHISSVLTV